MIDQFTSYSTKLERLSNDELHRSAEKAGSRGEHDHRQTHRPSCRDVEQEDRARAWLQKPLRILHNRPQLERGRGASTYSCGERFAALPAASLRSTWALAESRISLTVAALLAPHLTEDNVNKLISDCAGKKRRETEEYIVAFRPKPVFEPSIRKRPARPVQEESPSTSRSTSTSPAPPPPAPAETPKSSPTILQPAVPKFSTFAFQRTEISRQVRTARGSCGVDNAQKNMADILEKALDIALEKKDPKKRLERRRRKQRARTAKISFKRDGQKRRACRVSIRCCRSCRASPRT